MGFREGSYLGLHALFLLKKHATHLKIADAGQHRALHYGAAFVILDVSHPHGLGQRDLLGEALLLEIAYRVVVGVGQEVHDVARGLDVVLQMRHEVRAVTLDLLVAANGAEDDLGELAALERSVGDPPHDLERLLHDRYREMRSVVDQSRYVVLGHLRQLLLEYTFQAGEDDEGFALVVVVDDTELYLAVPFFYNGGLLWERDSFDNRFRFGVG